MIPGLLPDSIFEIEQKIAHWQTEIGEKQQMVSIIQMLLNAMIAMRKENQVLQEQVKEKS